MASRKILAVVLVICLTASMAVAQGLVDFPRSTLEVVGAKGKTQVLAVELAATPDQLTQGLMYRTRMEANTGMLFDFGKPRPVSMWMKNTLIPLDMIFIAADGRITGIHERAIPQSLAVISSPGAVKSVLELNGGAAQRLGLAVGDRVVHPWFVP
jgi:uncharacterized membrane protein (UPF0127 family)